MTRFNKTVELGWIGWCKQSYNWTQQVSHVELSSVVCCERGFMSAIMPLQRVQNAAAQPILVWRKSDHVTPALRQLHCLTVDIWVNYKLVTTMHSIHIGQCPAYFADMVRSVIANSTRSWLRSTDTVQYQQPRSRTAIGERAFSYAGSHAWIALLSLLKWL